ncbi:MAG: NfeD family protein [Eubacteriales bacterium]
MRNILLRLTGLFRPKHAGTGVEAIVGERVTVSERIDNLSGCGAVKIRGQEWAARSVSEGLTFEPGDMVTVVAVEGVKLICK